MMIMMGRPRLFTIHLKSTAARCPLPDTPGRQRDSVCSNHGISTDAHFPPPDTPIIPDNPENVAPHTMLYYPGITVFLFDTPVINMIKYFRCFLSLYSRSS